MGYKLTYQETILDEFRDIRSFVTPSTSPILVDIHNRHKANGNILDEGSIGVDLFNRTYWIIYKDKETADAIMAEMSAAVPDITRSVEGFYAHDFVWEEV